MQDFVKHQMHPCWKHQNIYVFNIVCLMFCIWCSTFVRYLMFFFTFNVFAFDVFVHLMFKCACFVKKLLNFVKFSHFIFVYFKLNVIVFSLVITTVRIHNFFVCLYTEFSRLESRDFSGVVMVHRCIFYRFLVGKWVN